MPHCPLCCIACGRRGDTCREHRPCTNAVEQCITPVGRRKGDGTIADLAHHRRLVLEPPISIVLN